MAEQILIRNLPDGTKAMLRSRAERHQRSVEAEARAILEAELTRGQPATINSYLAMPGGQDIEFEPERLGVTGRIADL